MLPVGAQGLDEGGQDEALDVGARGVVGAELVAVAGAEGAFEEGAEDGGLDLAPVGLGGLDEEGELDVVDGERVGVGEEAAVEAEDVAVRGRRRSRRCSSPPRGLRGVGATCSGVPREV